MKLSQAILLGQVLVPHPEACVLSACALGMGLKASGEPTEISQRRLFGLLPGRVTENYAAVERLWPWTAMAAKADSLPCGCPAEVDYRDCIIHLFDLHVVDDEMTLEQLVDWVASIEPPETCSECRSEQPVNEIQVCQECQP